MSDYCGVHFSLPTLKTEVDCLGSLARDFLDVESHSVLGSWSADLSTIGNRDTTKPALWKISPERPIRTKQTKQFEPNGRKVQQSVWGELSFVWEVARVSTDTRKKERTLICLNGKASTKVRIYTQIDDAKTCIAQWQVEIGSHDSPGWHFHVGLCREENDGHFPKWLSVPRMPGLLVAPTDALDFMLGELFQDDWKKQVSNEKFENVELGKAQKSRIYGMSKWHTAELEAGNGSAWNRLKRSQPRADIFTS